MPEPQIVTVISTSVPLEISYCREELKFWDDELTNDDIYNTGFSGFNPKSLYEQFKNNLIQPVFLSPAIGYESLIDSVHDLYSKFFACYPFTTISGFQGLKSLSPPQIDEIQALIATSGNVGGQNDWSWGNALEFTEQAHFMAHDGTTGITADNILGVTQLSPGVTKIKLAKVPYFTNAQWYAHISGVAGFQFNPNGRFQVQSRSTAFPDEHITISHNLGTGSWTNGSGSVYQNYLSGIVCVVASKLNRIRRKRNALGKPTTLGQARQIARLTGSNGGVWNITTGYGSIDVNAAIAYNSPVTDSMDELGEPGELISIEPIAGSLKYRATFERTPNAKLSHLLANGEHVVAHSISRNATTVDVVMPTGDLSLRIRSERDDQIDYSNNLNLNIMLSNKPIKSKYTLGDTVYYLENGVIKSSTVTEVLVEVTNPLNDSTGVQTNRYKIVDRIESINESEVFSSKNHLLSMLKGSSFFDTSFSFDTVLAFDNPGLRDVAGFDFNGGLDLSATLVIDFVSAITDNCNFSNVTLPANVDTKAEFRSVVKSYDENTTIWTDGNPIGRA